MWRAYMKLWVPLSYFTEKVVYIFMYWNFFLYTTMTKRAFLLSLLRNKTDLWTCFCSGDHRGISLSKHSSTCHPHNEYHPNKNKKNVKTAFSSTIFHVKWSNIAMRTEQNGVLSDFLCRSPIVKIREAPRNLFIPKESASARPIERLWAKLQKPQIET